MKGLAEFTKTTLIGGVLIILPIYLSDPAASEDHQREWAR
jgi:hypothetical protein